MARFTHFGPQRKKPARKAKGVSKAPARQRARIQSTAQGRAYKLTQNWILSIAEPRFANAIKQALELTDGDAWEAIQRHYLDPVDITYYVLQGEVPTKMIPLRTVKDNRYNFLKLQSENPKLENYYADEKVLEVYRKVHKKVQNALLRLRRSRRRRVLLFPV